MGTNIKNIQVLATLFLFAIYGCNSCKSLCVSGKTEYFFNAGTANFYPDKDSIKVGDTLWFTSIIPKRMRPIQNSQPVGDSIDFSGASDMTTDLALTSPLGIGSQTGAVDSFFIVPIKGNLQPNSLIPHSAKNVHFIEENNDYFLSLFLVAQKKGIYFADIADIFQAKKNCEVASIGIHIIDADKHLHYLQDIYYGGRPIAPIDSNSYCFKVY
ncbi:MAG: hypothetical protein JST47_09460 [Bacteroidetes bacterium]|nr:hypothetical protein [Bacteroidota bacterium]